MLDLTIKVLLLLPAGRSSGRAGELATWSLSLTMLVIVAISVAGPAFEEGHAYLGSIP